MHNLLSTGEQRWNGNKAELLRKHYIVGVTKKTKKQNRAKPQQTFSYKRRFPCSVCCTHVQAPEIGHKYAVVKGHFFLFLNTFWLTVSRLPLDCLYSAPCHIVLQVHCYSIPGLCSRRKCDWFEEIQTSHFSSAGSKTEGRKSGFKRLGYKIQITCSAGGICF